MAARVAKFDLESVVLRFHVESVSVGHEANESLWIGWRRLSVSCVNWSRQPSNVRRVVGRRRLYDALNSSSTPQLTATPPYDTPVSHTPVSHTPVTSWSLLTCIKQFTSDTYTWSLEQFPLEIRTFIWLVCLKTPSSAPWRNCFFLFTSHMYFWFLTLSVPDDWFQTSLGQFLVGTQDVGLATGGGCKRPGLLFCSNRAVASMRELYWCAVKNLLTRSVLQGWIDVAVTVWVSDWAVFYVPTNTV